jgi:RimJ/RimL family protein N-acetyltransferase
MDPSLAPPVRSRLGPVLTDRLDLRRFEAADVEALSGVFAKPEVWTFPYGRGLDRSKTEHFVQGQMEHWDAVGFGCWVARTRDTGAVIGYVGLSVPTFLPEILPAVEVGWRFDPAVWGRGLATEGATAALREGFATLGLDEICSLPQSANPRSWRVCERLGMRFERIVTCPATDRRGAVEAHLYCLTEHSWHLSRGGTE